MGNVHALVTEELLLRDPSIQVADVARRYGVSRTTLYKHVGVIAPWQ
ncbi:helix-turn-helix domain-containing protein [Paraburkholderia translucens]|nr:helix-turn-helix domain-containing protein [Paraburkholderia sp. MMS20-SJTN17]